jgi:hypothetical protein
MPENVSAEITHCTDIARKLAGCDLALVCCDVDPVPAVAPHQLATCFSLVLTLL